MLIYDEDEDEYKQQKQKNYSISYEVSGIQFDIVVSEKNGKTRYRIQQSLNYKLLGLKCCFSNSTPKRLGCVICKKIRKGSGGIVKKSAKAIATHIVSVDHTVPSITVAEALAEIERESICLQLQVRERVELE